MQRAIVSEEISKNPKVLEVWRRRDRRRATGWRSAALRWYSNRGYLHAILCRPLVIHSGNSHKSGFAAALCKGYDPPIKSVIALRFADEPV